MKQTIYILSALFLFSCGGVNYSSHKDVTNGFEIEYPQTWDTTNFDSNLSFIARESFLDSTDFFSEGFSIVVSNNQGNSLESIVDQNVEIARYYFKNTDIKRKIIKTENDIEGIELELIYDAEGLEFLNRASFFINNDKVYTITQTVESNKVEEYNAVFMHIINSLNWID